MARIHRPPPPVPTEEHEETEENYGVWAENEFDDEEFYENYDNEGNEECNSDYEEPDDPPNIPSGQRSASPMQPPVPPRQGARQAPVPTPSFLTPKDNSIPVGGGRVSPRVSPVLTDRRKFVPQPPVAIKDDDEMYEAVDPPISPPVDDGEVYSEVDDVPIPQKPIAVAEKRALPAFPKAGVSRPSVPNPPSILQTPAAKTSKSPNMGRREVPAPPSVKSIPTNNRLFTPARTTPQPPSPQLQRNEEEAETEEMYEEGDFYQEKESTQAFAAGKFAKPVPRPPQNNDLEQDDEYYTEVPESNKPSVPFSKAGRPIPPVPLPLSAPMQPPAPAPGFAGSTRIPVEKLKAGLARLAEAKANATAADNQDSDSGKSREDSGSGSFSANAFLDAKKLLKPVNRGESMNSQQKPPTVSVKRAESESSRAAVRGGFEQKGSLFSEMKNKLDAKNTESVKPTVKLPPVIQYEDVEPVKKTETPNRRTLQTAAAVPKPPPPILSENSARKPLVPKDEPDDNFTPPKVPAARNFPGRGTANSGISVNLDSNDFQKRPNFPAQVVKETKPAAPETKRGLPPVPAATIAADDLGGLYSFAWYFSSIERQNAERKILEINQDGAYLVRKSQRGGDSNPYTLTVLYSGHVYNLHIRKRPDRKFALGTEKPDEHVFNSVVDLVTFHNNNPIEVVGDARKNLAPGKVILKSTPRK